VVKERAEIDEQRGSGLGHRRRYTSGVTSSSSPSISVIFTATVQRAPYPHDRLRVETLWVTAEEALAGDGGAYHPSSGDKKPSGVERVVHTRGARYQVSHVVGDGRRGKVTSFRVHHRSTVEGGPASIEIQLLRFPYTELPILVADPEERLPSCRAVNVIADLDFDQRQMIILAVIVDAGHDLEAVSDRRIREVHRRLSPFVHHARTRATDPFDRPLVQAHRDKSAVRVGEADHELAERARLRS